MPRLLICLLLLAAIIISSSAHAHVGDGLTGGFLGGFEHPLFGPDHVVAMVAVGLWGAFLGAPAIWLLPVVFPLVMAFGGALGILGVPIPGIEVGIAVSAIVLGLMVALAARPPLWVAAGSEASIRRAAARGFNLILDQYAGPEQLAERIDIYRSECKTHGRCFDPMQVAVARQLYVARDEADKHAALKRQAAYTKRTVDVSRAPGGKAELKAGSHVLAYADKTGGTEEHALFGTPDEICAKLENLQHAGVQYVLLTVAGGVAQLHRLAREIMPAFARSASTALAAE